MKTNIDCSTIDCSTIDCSIYCSIYRKNEREILTQLPLQKIYEKQYNNNNMIIKSINSNHDMMFCLKMIRGKLINFENLYLLVEHYSKKNDNLEILLNCKVDINIRDKNQSTLLIKATSGSTRQNKKIIEKLIDARCDLDVIDNNLNSALVWASHNGYTEMAAKLINARCAIDIQDKYQHTPLMWASRRGHIEIVNILINAGCRLDIQDFNGYTTLLWTSLCGQTEIVRKLIDARCKPNIKNNYNETALDIAKTKDNQQIIDLLMLAENKN